MLEGPIHFLLMIFFFGFCIFIHEFGHLLAALWCKLHIERFSIGFGKPIWKKVIKGVEYRLSWLPFGGYVALPQMEPSDTPMTSEGEELPEAASSDAEQVLGRNPAIVEDEAAGIRSMPAHLPIRRLHLETWGTTRYDYCRDLIVPGAGGDGHNRRQLRTRVGD